MFNATEGIKGLGDYASPLGTKAFSQGNVIFGWNYSGKTALS